MALRSHRLGEVDASLAARHFTKCGGIHLSQAISADVVERAFGDIRALFADQSLLESFPHDAATRLGYTPRGVEALQGDRPVIDSRHTFDYRPGMGVGGTSIAALYYDAVSIGLRMLSHLDAYFGTHAESDAILGTHYLSTAQYLVAHSTPDEVIFPSHLDFGFLTVFIGSGTSGLQVLVKDAWEDVELGYGDVLVGIGTPLIQFFSQSLRPLRHRVVGGDGERTSAFLFIEPGDQVVLPAKGERYGAFRDPILRDIRNA